MTSAGFNILIIDDEPNIRSGLAQGLISEADVIETAGDAEDALAIFGKHSFQLVIADVRLHSRMGGIELMQKMLFDRPETSVIVITAHGTVESAVAAMRAGAFDFLSKPLDLNLVRQQVRKARKHHVLQIENRSLRSQLANAGEISGIIGNCTAMQQVFHQIRQVSNTDATVMILGESGTGKELIARALHDLSDRSANPFLAVNLGAMPESLLESELFGHEKGSFTGASRQKPGCFEQANHGTLFLDEVTEMSARSQVDLLRVLETGQLTRVGGEQLIQTDVRVLSATNKSVQDLITEGLFREDLFYRLNVVPIQVPSLRQRRDDIPLLVEHFLRHFCRRHNRPSRQVSPEAMTALVAARWPGNIRQLRNVMERLVVSLTSDMIHVADLPSELSAGPASNAITTRTLAEAVEECERDFITMALQECDCHREKTAQRLGVSVRTLHYKMGRYGLH
jgi:DNA-binding NtrC family response regulator